MKTRNWFFLFVVAFLGLSFGYILSKFCTQFIQSHELAITNALPIVLQEIGDQPTVPQASTPIPQSSSVKMLFGGDLMFDRTIRQKAEKEGYEFILKPLEELFAQYDVVVANLEGPITTAASRSVNSAIGSTNNYIFTFDPKVLELLRKNHFTIVNIGNNHIGNFGKSGIEETKNFLKQGNIHYFGNTGYEESESERVNFQQFGQNTFAFVNMNQFVEGGFETGIEDVQFARNKANTVVVFTHWGNEYQPVANQVIVNQAHQLIDAGADLIIGTHPHVTQQTEEYKGKFIYYSLGNFVFDQYFSAETQHGLLVGVEIMWDGSMKFSDIPIQLQKNGQTSLGQ